MLSTYDIVDVLKRRGRVLVFKGVTFLSDPTKTLAKAFEAEPALACALQSYSGSKEAGEGIRVLQTSYRLTLEYRPGLPPHEKIIVDNGKWKPSDAFADGEIDEYLWVVTTDTESVASRADADYQNLKALAPQVKGLTWTYNDDFCGSKYKTIIFHLEQFSSGTQLKQFMTISARQASLIVSQHFGGDNAKRLPAVIRIFLAFAYLQRECNFDNVADQTKNDEKPVDPWASLAYGPLYKKLGTALGIACAMQLLLKKMDINCRVVEGYADDDGTMIVHTWCMVQVGDDWYHVDPTFGVNGNMINISRFMMNDAQMVCDYSWDQDLYPKCLQTHPNYKDVCSYVSSHEDVLNDFGVNCDYYLDDYVDI